MNELRIESIHCDRLTITGRLDWERKRDSKGDWYNSSVILDKLFNPIGRQIEKLPNRSVGMYSHDFKVLIEESESSIFIQVNRYHTPDRRDFRVDFNPSKLTQTEKEWLRKILIKVQDKKVTRYDMAIEFHHDLKDYVLADGRSRSSVEYKDRYGNIETLYRGSRESEDYLKLYDKRKERKSKYKDVKHDWWRIEETIKDKKGQYWRTYNWFENIRLTNNKPIFPKDTSPRFKSAALCVLNKLMKLDEFPKNDRTKINRLLQAITFEESFNVGEEIKKAPYQQMLNDAIQDIDDYLS